jgi:hypothetical protein
MENPPAATSQDVPKRRMGRPTPPPPSERCTATSKGSGDQCLNYREGGTTVCRFHGSEGVLARQKQAVASGQGRESLRLPVKLQQRFNDFLGDPDILNLSRDLALLNVRLDELTSRLEDGESVTGWRRAREAFGKLRAGLAASDGAAIRDAVGRLSEIITGATATDNTWRDIRDLLLERRLLAETERRRLVDLHQMVTVSELMVLMNAIIKIVYEEVPEPKRRTAIAMKLRALMNRQAATRSGRVPRDPEPETVDVQSTVVGRGDRDESYA